MSVAIQTQCESAVKFRLDPIQGIYSHVKSFHAKVEGNVSLLVLAVRVILGVSSPPLWSVSNIGLSALWDEYWLLKLAFTSLL